MTESEKVHFKLLEKCHIQIAESPVEHGERILPSTGVPNSNKRADVIENIFRQLDFDTCLNDLLCSDKIKLWNSVAQIQVSIAKLKLMKNDTSLSCEHREIIFMTEKFFGKINLFLLSISRSDTVPKSVYLDLFSTFLDICGIITLPGEMFQRNSLFAGDVYSSSPEVYLLPVNASDTSLRTVGILSYSEDPFNLECIEITDNPNEVTGKGSQSTFPKEGTSKNYDYLSVRAQMTQRWVQSLPTKFDTKPLLDEIESANPNHNIQENALSVQRKRTFEGRIKQPAVKLSPTNAVINKIPIIITLAPDDEEKMQQNPCSSEGPLFQIPKGKISIPSRLFEGVRSAMEQEYTKYGGTSEQIRTRVIGLTAGRIPDPSFQAPGRKLDIPVSVFDAAFEQKVPSSKTKAFKNSEKCADSKYQQQTTDAGKDEPTCSVPGPSFKSAGRKINIPKGLFDGVRSALEHGRLSSEAKNAESGFAKLLLPVTESSPADVKETKTKNLNQVKAQSFRETKGRFNEQTGGHMDTTQCIGNENTGSTNEETEDKPKRKENDSDAQKIYDELSNEPGTSWGSKRRKLDSSSVGSDPELEQDTVRSSAENNQNTSSQVNSNAVCVCSCHKRRKIIHKQHIYRNRSLNEDNSLRTSIETAIPAKNMSARQNIYAPMEGQLPAISFNNSTANQNMSVKEKGQYVEGAVYPLDTNKELCHTRSKVKYSSFKRQTQTKIKLLSFNITEKYDGKGNNHGNNICKKRKKLFRKKRKKKNRKERLSSDSGLPDSSVYTGNTNLTFHGRFETDSQSSDSFSQSFLQERQYYKNNQMQIERPMHIVTSLNMSRKNTKINSKFLSGQVEVSSYCHETKRHERHKAKESKRFTTQETNRDIYKIHEIEDQICERPRPCDRLRHQPMADWENLPTTSFSTFGDKNVNAFTHDCPFPVDFVQNLLLELPNTITNTSSVGFILHKTKVMVTVLEMSHQHYEHITVDGVATADDRAEVNYIHVLDILKMSDRIYLARILSELAFIGR